MDIDIERLKWDAEYWDEVAPEWATHYVMDTNNPWEMHLGHGIFDLRDNRFCKYAKPGEVHMETRIPRPTKPAAPEWDENELPPKGARCEVQMGSYWYAGEVIGKTKEAIWFKSDERSDYWTIMSALSCRPIRTQADRDKEEIAQIIWKFSANLNIKTARAAADAIISQVFRKGNNHE